MPHSPDIQAGQHGRGATAENPHCKEDDEERRAEHHLPGVGGRVTNGQGKRHGSSQPCRGRDGGGAVLAHSTGSRPHRRLPHPGFTSHCPKCGPVPLTGHPPPEETTAL